MKPLVLAYILVTSDCGYGGMSNETAYQQIKFCVDHGLRPQVIQNSYSEIIAVHCLPYESKK